MTPKELTQEEVKELFEYKDGILYWKTRPSNSIKAGSIAGYINNPSGYVKTTIKGRLLLNHRIIFLRSCAIVFSVGRFGGPSYSPLIDKSIE